MINLCKKKKGNDRSCIIMDLIEVGGVLTWSTEKAACPSQQALCSRHRGQHPVLSPDVQINANNRK